MIIATKTFRFRTFSTLSTKRVLLSSWTEAYHIYLLPQYRTKYLFVTFHRNIIRRRNISSEKRTFIRISICLNSIVNCRISPDANNLSNCSCFFFISFSLSLTFSIYWILKVILNLTDSIATKFNGLFEWRT